MIRDGKAYFGKIEDVERPDRGPGVWLPLLVGAAVWARMVSLYFIGDDFEHLAWSRAPFFESVWDLARHGRKTFLRPFASATIFLEYRLWGTWPNGYHITNLGIHLVGVAGLFYLCRRLRFGLRAAAIASLIYAVLPIEVEAVAWMGARFDLLSACLSIWTAFFYVYFRQTAKPVAYVAALLCFFFALLSKENSYVFPFILLVAEYLIMPRRILKAPAGFFVLAGGLFLYRWFILGGIGGYSDRSGRRIALHFDFKILQGLFIRDPALLLFGYNWSEPRLATTILIIAVTSAALLLLLFFYRPAAASWKTTAFCLAWIVFPLLPIHPLLLINPDLSNSRILYFSSAGIAMLIGHLLARSGANHVHGREDARMRWIAAVLLVCAYSLGTVHNIGAWRWTTERQKRFLSELQRIESSPQPNAKYKFENLPTAIRGVYFMETDASLRDAIRVKLGRYDIEASRESVPLDGPFIRIQWTGKEDPLIIRAMPKSVMASSPPVAQ